MPGRIFLHRRDAALPVECYQSLLALNSRIEYAAAPSRSLENGYSRGAFLARDENEANTLMEQSALPAFIRIVNGYPRIARSK